MNQAVIFIRDASIAANKPDGTQAYWWMGEEGVTLLQLLARVCFTISHLFPDAGFLIVDQRTLKPVPAPEDNRVDLNKAA